MRSPPARRSPSSPSSSEGPAAVSLHPSAGSARRSGVYCFQGLGRILELGMAEDVAALMTANEAASVTGVPLRQVHRIIDAGLLGGAVKRRRNARLLARGALVGLKLAHETADVLTHGSRRAVVAALIRRPRQSIIRFAFVVVD